MPELNQQIDDCLDYIEFAVKDIEQTKVFYSKVFGWTFTDYAPTYCEFSDGRMKGGFHTHEPVEPGGPLVVLYHSDLQKVQHMVKEAGGKITKEIFEFPGGERFEFTDVNGYRLGVWRTRQE